MNHIHHDTALKLSYIKHHINQELGDDHMNLTAIFIGTQIEKEGRRKIRIRKG